MKNLVIHLSCKSHRVVKSSKIINVSYIPLLQNRFLGDKYFYLERPARIVLVSKMCILKLKGVQSLQRQSKKPQPLKN